MTERFKERLERKITQISAMDFTVNPFSFEQLLVSLSRGYERAGQLRSLLYQKGVLKSKKLACPVISIGNIVAGGSGKTPMAIHVAGLVKAMGFKPVVVSRGYGGTLEAAAGIVGNGKEVLLSPEQAGDEPVMMAGRHSFPVVVGRDRFQAGLVAIAAFDPDVIILDDGFQHLKLHRDLDIVLLDAGRPLGNGRLLPAGRLREPAESIRQRGDIVVFTRCEKIPPFLRQPLNRGVAGLVAEKPVFMTCHTPFMFCHKPSGTRGAAFTATLDCISGKRALLFSGISDNPGFRKSVEHLGARVEAHLEFRDHHRYNRHDIRRIKAAVEDRAVDLLITTEKDYARLDRDLVWPLDLAVIGIEIEFVKESERFKGRIENIIQKGLS